MRWKDWPIKKLDGSFFKKIYKPPKVIYYRGNINPKIFEKSLAIVGSRRMTRYGKEVIDRFIPELVTNNVTITMNRTALDGLKSGTHYFTYAYSIFENSSVSPNLTLNQSRAHSLGSPSYNHDTAKLNEMLRALAWQASRISPKWAENLQAQGAQINETWLKTTTMILAGKNPVPVKGA